MRRAADLRIDAMLRSMLDHAPQPSDRQGTIPCTVGQCSLSQRSEAPSVGTMLKAPQVPQLSQHPPPGLRIECSALAGQQHLHPEKAEGDPEVHDKVVVCAFELYGLLVVVREGFARSSLIEQHFGAA